MNALPEPFYGRLAAILRPSAFQAGCRGFESRLPLHTRNRLSTGPSQASWRQPNGVGKARRRFCFWVKRPSTKACLPGVVKACLITPAKACLPLSSPHGCLPNHKKERPNYEGRKYSVSRIGEEAAAYIEWAVISLILAGVLPSLGPEEEHGSRSKQPLCGCKAN